MAQNSVKYNIYKGDVVILVTCKPLKEDGLQGNNLHVFNRSTTLTKKKYMLETKVIDSGIGISTER
jgi:hypothetical protein